MDDDGFVYRNIRGGWAVKEGMGSRNVEQAVGGIQILPDPPYAVDLAVVEIESRVAVGEEHITSGITANGHVATKVHALIADERGKARVVIEANIVCL